MRKISVVLIAAMLLAVGSLRANNPLTEKPIGQLAAQIGELLKDNGFTENFVGLTADIRFTVNRDYEIVILTVDTKDDELEYLLKSRLNYKKVARTSAEEGGMYSIPIRIKG